MDEKRLKKILENHELCLAGKGGARANFSGCDLAGTDFEGAYLHCGLLKRAKKKNPDTPTSKDIGSVIVHLNFKTQAALPYFPSPLTPDLIQLPTSQLSNALHQSPFAQALMQR